MPMDTSYPLTSLFLYLTDRCNLCCSHCWISPRFSEKTQEGIAIDGVKKAVQEAKDLGLQSVKLTGGEPLLYRQLDRLLDYLSKQNLTITIETNGTLLTPDLVSLFKDTGVFQVAVSLDAGAADIHDAIRGIKGCFSRTVQGLGLLSKAGIHFQVIMTLQKKNRFEIPGVIELCEKFSAASLKVNHLVSCGRGRETVESGNHLGVESLVALYRDVNEVYRRPEALQVIFDLPVAFRSIHDITHKGVCECAIFNILGILANGDISICGIGQTVPALRMGNIYRDSIERVWRDSPLLKDLRGSLPAKLEGICGQCIFRFQCLGECRAHAYAARQNLFAANPLCQALYDAGRFPESRYDPTDRLR